MKNLQPGTATGSFPAEVKTKALVACKRFCCLCERPSGIKMHCHHINPASRGGPDTFENCIPLCLNCHAEVEAYNDKHPMGNKFRPEELKQRRDTWYKAVAVGPMIVQQTGIVEADRATFADLQACLPSTGSIQFIREFSFGFSLREDFLKDLESFAYERRGPEHEFLNEELEAQRKHLRAKIGTLLVLIGTNMGPLKHNLGFLEVPSELELRDAKAYFKAVEALGKAADEVCEAYDSLVRLCRKSLA